jgi:SAM-dependent methyltransferase
MNFEQIRKSIFFNFLNKLSNNLGKFINIKEPFEYLYWQIKKWEEGHFNNQHFEYFYTIHFGLSSDHYSNKSILDIGCGPRGSLEWAKTASLRIGLDPLAHKYAKMNKGSHQMKYVVGNCEQIPFESSYFDIVSSFNSLDHAKNPIKCISEICRVLKPGGIFLLIVDIHESPTVTEPSPVSWQVTKQISSELQLLSEDHFEGHRMYKSIRDGLPFDHDNPAKRYGILSAKFIKPKPV